jgi:hypothetical protein
MGITTFSLLNRLPYISNRGIVVLDALSRDARILFVFSRNILCISLSMSFLHAAHYSAEFPISSDGVGVGVFGGCISLNFLSFSTLRADLPLHLSLKYLFNSKAPRRM